MSSPSSQQSNPPRFKDQIFIARSKDQKMSDEEIQLLNANSDDEEYDNTTTTAATSNKRNSRYYSAPFIWFMIASTILPLIIVLFAFIMDSTDTPFSLSFVLGIITCIFGACYFIPHMALKDAIIETYTLNQTKRMQTEKMGGEIKKIGQYKDELQQSRQKIMDQNKETKQLLANLQMMNVDSFEELNVQKGRAQKIYKEWFNALLKKERVLLHTLYDRFEFMDNSPGMTKNEFEEFAKNLPDGYSQRMNRLGTFEKLSKGNGIILYDDFKSALDVFAEMELNDTDIDFEIEKKETGVDDTGNKTYLNSIITKSIKARRMVQNKWFASKDEQK